MKTNHATRVKAVGKEVAVIRHPAIGNVPGLGGAIVLEDMYTKPTPRLV